MSKIRFESNSQLVVCGHGAEHGCFQYVKDTLWKQFTTDGVRTFQFGLLFPICQRYALKAIHNMRPKRLAFMWLFPICQRYALKAIHNGFKSKRKIVLVVSNMSKIRFESNSQQKRTTCTEILVVSNMSKIRFESNSQHQAARTVTVRVVSNMSKIRFESNSQHMKCRMTSQRSCFQYVKDTLWKQFTTARHTKKAMMSLFPICQRYALKAIHNRRQQSYSRASVVSNMSKIRFESNSQHVW